MTTVQRLSGIIAVVLMPGLFNPAQAQAPAPAGYSGAQLYRTYCASCHGPRGQGDGPVASSLKVEVPDLTRISARQGRFPADQIRKIIDGRTTLPPHGTRDMPVWGWAFQSLSPDDARNEPRIQALIDSLTEYLRSIQQR